METNKKLQEVIFKKFHPLVKVYARKLFNLDLISFEVEDVEQELSIRLFKAIQKYLLNWQKYKQTKKHKPMPLQCYVRLVMNNRIKDLMFQIMKQKRLKCLDEYEIGYETNFSCIDVEKNKYVIDNIDLLDKLQGQEKKIFILYLRGYNVNKLTTIFKGLNVNKIVNKHCDYLVGLKGEDYSLKTFVHQEFQDN